MTRRSAIVLMGILVVLDALAWSDIALGSFGKRLELFFFDVGQGDSEMIAMPGNVKLLIDGGPANGKAAASLGEVLPWGDGYIDAIMVSHLELDHFGGLMDVLKRYDVGAFIYNGRTADSESAKELMHELKRKRISVVAVGEGDSITYEGNTVHIISAERNMTAKGNANESAIVARFAGGGVTALFTGDIGSKTEQRLIHEGNMRADILKIPHHGSKFSSTKELLQAVRPRIAVIEVGKNSYGHPTKEVLDRIAAVGAQLLRTDRRGMIRMTVEKGIRYIVASTKKEL